MTDQPIPLFGDSDDEAEAQRLNEALEALAAGRDPGVDPREDPELHELVQTASVLEQLLVESTETHAFASFRHRSRFAVIHRAETLAVGRQLAERSSASAREQLAAAGRALSMPIGRSAWLRRRLIPVIAPVAAAAAAAGVTFFAMGSAAGTLGVSGPDVASSVIATQQVGEPAQAPAENLTPRSLDEQLARLQTTFAQIAGSSARGEAVSTALLRSATEDTASVKRQIDSAPNAVSAEAVASYAQAATQGQAILGVAKAEPGGEGALSAAQVTAEQAVVTAARYFAERAAPTPTATAEPTSTATAEPTETPEASATPGAAAEATAAPTDTPAAPAASAPVRPDPAIE